MIFLTDSTNAVTPAYSTIMEMIAALRYSVRPCPSGCFLSGALPASFVPMIVMRDDSASLRLLTASITTAIEWEAMPTNALKAARNTLAMMPMTLVRMMMLSLFILFSYSFSAAVSRARI